MEFLALVENVDKESRNDSSKAGASAVHAGIQTGGDSPSEGRTGHCGGGQGTGNEGVGTAMSSVAGTANTGGGGGGGGYTDSWVTAVAGKTGGSGVVIIKEAAILDLQNTSGMWTMNAVYTARVGDNWT